MRKSIVFVLLFSFLFIASSVNREYTKEIKFQDETFVRASLESNNGQFLAEFIPEDTTFKNFEKMVAVYYYKGDLGSAKSQAFAKHEEIKQRNADGDPIANGVVYVKEDDTQQAIYDFVLSDKEWTIAERNVMLFKNEPEGMLLVKYVERMYLEDKNNEDMKVFFEKILKNRQSIVDELTETEWQIPDLGRK
ncbi:MAG: hypothetical protein JXR81_06630 [Candidatus Goldbacteria bacterium]|nr:hypothetical protein [Candidatus Goldiibacteriota bacterium]